MAKLNIKISQTNKALLEHYGYGVIAAGYATFQTGHRTVKEVVVGALVGGLLVPILAKINPKSLVNTITKETGAPAPLVEAAVNAAVAEGNKIAKAETTK
jgi:uncharacterized membrane protein YkvI